MEIWQAVQDVVGEALAKADIDADALEAVGVTNQRETTVVWDRTTGEPVYNAIVWQDTRTAQIVEALGGDEGQDRYKSRVGLPLATYFCGPKVKWILDNVDGARERAEAGELVMGTIDTWVVWHLNGGVAGDAAGALSAQLDQARSSSTVLSPGAWPTGTDSGGHRPGNMNTVSRPQNVDTSSTSTGPTNTSGVNY